eukprot:TRINITY_DN4242_c0_g2_i2.p1 TRINITY_DN4242_c0_g2~~TRINITY_DN4242_c0_g2_i2.p1  ORF type:complete len:692 (+),score=134.93 TRINITY_DN4242_c0_g2_i2:172-2076(+)
MANQAVHIGSSNSYLDVDKIIHAAKATHSDAIHPGFGFLSENADFAERCESNGIIFVGPSSKSISAMGSKSEAKKLLTSSERHRKMIPVIPGYHGDKQDDQTLISEAKKIGYPVLLKASAGGGGKGMRVVWKDDELHNSISSARREAKEAFGDDKILVEKYFPSVRHVEIQIMADSYGNVVHLFERDCSIQRRHQKVIEETPSPVMNDNLIKRMGDAAVEIGQTIQYKSAGTVEFIVGEHNDFYFLEVNTRLQVEHPITEAITGLDLVELQIKIAEGHSLPSLGINSQDSIKRHGHAIQCRLYAEDPLNDFVPCPGKILQFIPAQVEGIRYDSGVTSGSEISIYYDPMIAKVIAWGRSRSESLQKMRAALLNTVFVGTSTTNQKFLLAVLNNKSFVDGNYNTAFIQNQFPLETRKSLIDFVDDSITTPTCIASTLFMWALNQKSRELWRHVSPGFRNALYKWENKKFEQFGKVYQVDYQVQRLRKDQVSNPNVQLSTSTSTSISTSTPMSNDSDNTKSYFHSFKFRIISDSNPSDSSPPTHNVIVEPIVDFFHNADNNSHTGEIACTIDGNRTRFWIYLTDVDAQQNQRCYVHSSTINGMQIVRALPRLTLPAKKDGDSSGGLIKYVYFCFNKF